MLIIAGVQRSRPVLLVWSRIQTKHEDGVYWPTSSVLFLCCECGRSPGCKATAAFWWVVRKLRLLDQCWLIVFISIWLVWEEWTEITSAKTWVSVRGLIIRIDALLQYIHIETSNCKIYFDFWFLGWNSKLFKSKDENDTGAENIIEGSSTHYVHNIFQWINIFYPRFRNTRAHVCISWGKKC